MAEYLIAYSSIKNTLEMGGKFGLEIAQKMLDAHNSLQVDNKIVHPIEFQNVLDSFINEKINYKTALSTLDNSLLSMLKKEKQIDWAMLPSLIGRQNVFRVLDEFKNRMSNRDYWSVLANCYTMSDFCYKDYDTLITYLNCERPEREYLMDEQERTYLKGLPEEITVYRGCSVEEIESENYRFSWTLSKERAEFFAYKYPRNQNIECDVIERTIKKADVIAYFNGREEEEILIISDYNPENDAIKNRFQEVFEYLEEISTIDYNNFTLKLVNETSRDGLEMIIEDDHDCNGNEVFERFLTDNLTSGKWTIHYSGTEQDDNKDLSIEIYDVN